MLHKEIPFLRIGLPFCAGVISGLYFKPDNSFLVQAVIVIIAGFSVSLFFNKYQANLPFGISLSSALFLFGLILYTNEKSSISILKPETTLFGCTLADYPAEKENSYMLTVNLNCKITSNGNEVVKGSMIIYNKKDSSSTLLLPGDQMIIKCIPVEIVNRGNPYEFDYRFYMENQGIRYCAFTNSHNIISHIAPKHRNLVYRALIIREQIIDMYRERGITGERLGLVAAIILGQKNMIDREQKQNFIKAGIMHIMAVSGLHAVILSMVIFNLLFFLKRRFNILRIVLTIIILWSFAFVTGLTPSVLRATLMFSFLQAGNLLKRRVNGINSVLASAFILIVIKPSVIFDAGFLLSYAAVIYIICFYQDLYLKLKFKNWLNDQIWQSAAVTIVAQAGTLPLTIMLFNRFPTYFILTNIIIVPVSSLVIIIGCIVPMLYPIHFLSMYSASILSFLTGLTELLTARASSLPGSNIENIGMTTFNCIMLFATIFIFSYFILKKRPFSILYPIVILIIFVTGSTFSDISTRTTNELIVYNTPGVSTIGIKTGKILNIYSDTTVTGPEVLRYCATLGLKTKTNILKNKVYCISTGEKRILISSNINNNLLHNFKPDIVILTGVRPEIESNLLSEQLPKTLILTSESSSGYSLSRNADLALISTVYLVRKTGAFIQRI